MDLIAYIACSNYEPLCMVNDEDMINEVLGTN